MDKSAKRTGVVRKVFIAIAALFVAVVAMSFVACTEVTAPPEFYSVTVSAVEHGTVTPSVASAAEGETVTLTVTPDNGYALSELKYNGTDITEAKSFTMPADAVNITAVFVARTFSITTGACEHGTVSVATTAVYGSTVSVTATPDSCYKLVTVKLNGAAINGLQFVMPANDVTVTAEFEVIKYDVTVTAATNGKVTASAIKAAAGETVTVTATPNSGYTLKSLVYNDGTEHDILLTKQFTMPAVGVTVTAEFEVIKYDITVAPSTYGTVIASATKAAVGTTVTITAIAENGYGLKSLVYNDGTDHDILSEKQFTMPAGIVTVTAVFEQVYSVTVGDIEHGTVTADKTVAFAGETINLTVEPEASYALKELKFNDEEVDISGTEYSFTMPAEDVTLTARFNTAHVITTSTVGNGTLTVAAKAAEGVKITVTATPNKGYELKSLKWNDGTDHDITTEKQFIMPDCAVTVTATFGKIDYTVTAAATENGMISVDETAQMGDTVTVTATADTGYELKSLKWNDGTDHEIDVSGALTFEMPASNVTVTASFGKIDYTVTAATAENGTISVATTAQMGDTVTVTATADTGYELKSLKWNDGTNDTTIDISGALTFTMPANVVTITATFGKKNYTVTAAATENGTISVAATAQMGDTVTVTATADTGYELKSLKWNDGTDHTIDISGVLTFTMPANVVTITATFGKIDYTVTAATADNGTISAATIAQMGDTVTITATPSTGYELKSLKWNDGTDHTIDISGALTFTMPANVVTITATFGKKNYTVTAAATENGTISVAATAQMGDTVTVTATADTGYELKSLIWNDGTDHEIDVSGALTFTMPANNVTVTASFGKINYTVTAATADNGTISAATTAQMGDTVTITATPSTGYKLTSLIYNDGADHTIDISGALTFGMPAHDVTVTATFGKIDYTVTAATADNGSITVAATAQMGDTVTLTVAPDTGYGMTALRISYTDGEQTVVKYLREALSFEMPAANVTVLATFKQITHIASLADFTAMAAGDLDGYYVLDNDIEFTTGANSPTVGVAPLIEATGFADERAFTFDKEGTVQVGKAFTGVFDGQGYVLIGFTLNGSDNTYQNYYRGLFGYIGESGIVRNFTLRDAKVNGAKECAIVSGVNLGLIRNVVIEDNCSIYATYKGIGAVAAYNGGIIQGAVSYVQKGTSNYGDVAFADGALAYESNADGDEQKTYVTPETDITDVMGDGWFYHTLVGTVYGNDTYKKFISVETAVFGQEFGIQVYQKVAGDPSFYVWSGSIGNSGTPFEYVRYDGETYTYYEKLSSSLDYLAVDSVDLGINIGGRYICKAVTLNIGGPHITTVNFGNISAAGDPYPGTNTTRRLNLFDNNANTAVAFSRGTTGAADEQKVNGYVAIDLGRGIELEVLRITIGRISNTNELVNAFAGHIEVSADNETFTDIGSFYNGQREFVIAFAQGNIPTVRYIHIVLDASPGGWTAVSDIYLNDVGDCDVPYVSSYNMGTPSKAGISPYLSDSNILARASDGDENSHVSFDKTERAANGYVQYDFLRTIEITALRAVLGRLSDNNGNITDTFAGEVQYSLNGTEFYTIGAFTANDRNFVYAWPPSEGISARYIRIVMKTVPNGWTAVSELFINDLGAWTQPFVGKQTDGALASNTRLENLVDGDPDTTVRFDKTNMKAGDYIFVDLISQTHIEFIRLINGYNKSGADKMNAVIEYWQTGDTTGWTEIDDVSGIDSKLVVDITTRYLRLKLKAVPATWVGLRELYINSWGDTLGYLILDGFSDGTRTGDEMVYRSDGASEPEYALDGNTSTKLWLRNPTVGKSFDLRLAQPTDISALRLLTGKTDYFIGTIDYTTDGVNYNTLCTITASDIDLVSENRTEYIFTTAVPIAGVVRLRFNWGESASWLQLYEIYINSLGDVKAVCTNNNFGTLADGSSLKNIFDGDDSTYAEFEAPSETGGCVTVDLLSVNGINNIVVLTGKSATDADSAVAGHVEISADGVTFTSVGNLTGNCTVFDFATTQNVRYIRIVNDGTTNTAIREIKINVLNSVLQSITWTGGFGSFFHGSFNDVIDNNNSTYVHSNATPKAGDYVEITLNDEMTINNIYVLSGTPSSSDTFVGKITYSLDGVTWVDVEGGALTTVENTVTLDTPIRAKYIRLENTGSAGWVAFREIQINKAA